MARLPRALASKPQVFKIFHGQKESMLQDGPNPIFLHGLDLFRKLVFKN